jgi:hypothetical protein
MRVAIFFTCLCFLLLRGEGYAFSNTQQANSCFSPATTHTHQQVAPVNANRDFTVIEDSTPVEEEEYFVSDDVEEEDAGSFLVRKYKLLDRFHLALSQLFTLSYLHKCFKAPASSWGHISNIYLTQSVLRI